MSTVNATKPFVLVKPKSKKYYYCRFKNSAGEITASRSTGTADKKMAEAAAWKMVNVGLPKKGEVIPLEFQAVLTRLKTMTKSETKLLAGELRKLGTFACVIEKESESAINFGDFLLNFWDYEKSPYIQEKISQKPDSIHRGYAHDQQAVIKNYWIPFFQDRILGSISRADIQKFRQHINEKPVSSVRKTCVMLAGGLPLKWAANQGLIPSNVSTGLIRFVKNSKKREILPPEFAGYLLSRSDFWNDTKTQIANIVAAATGLRSGELRGLRVMDIGQDKIHVRHGWGKRDKLKCPKGRKQRVVYVPQGIIEQLLDLAGKNPHGTAPDSFVFWDEDHPTQPIADSKFLNDLRSALLKSGMTRQEAGKYCFHGWRHFYSTVMARELKADLLRSQTGHLTPEMLEVYSDHQLTQDEQEIRQAQEQAFKDILPMKLLTA